MLSSYSKAAPCCGYFYYNDHELLHMTDSELKQKVSIHKKNGAEYVIAFSLTHFRWSFYPYEQLIIDAIARFVDAFHEQGIKFVEHHSANLIWNNEQKDCLDIVKMRFAIRQSRIENWPHLPEYYGTDWEIDGIPVKSMLQVNGNSGNALYDDLYGAVAFCPNNTDFVKTYLNYLGKLYDVGIDGVMTDDIEFFNANACTCRHCRETFEKQTGYILPAPGTAWDKWFGDYDNESFRAWLRFRYDVIRNFHTKVTKHYESRGLKMFRPWYISSTVSSNAPLAYVFDDLPELDVAYQENIFNDVIRYNWSKFILEGAHRFALGRIRGIPAVSQFYPDREDTVRLAWSISMSCGQGYMGTCHNSDEYPFEAENDLRAFEKDNKSYLTGVKKIAQIAFFDSLENRRFYKNYNTVSSKMLTSWSHACIHYNIPWDILLDSEVDMLPEYEVIVLPELAILSEAQISSLMNYVDAGGTLLWGGESATQNTDGTALCIRKYIPEFEGHKQELKIGKGKILFPPEDLLKDSSDSRINVNRWLPEKDLYADAALLEKTEKKEIRKKITDYILNLFPEKTLSVKDAPEDFRVTLFENVQKDLIIHLVNAVNTLSCEGNKLRHTDRVPFPGLQGTVSLKVKKIPGIAYNDVSLRRPGKITEAISFTEDSKYIHIDIDASQIEFYGLVTITADTNK